jgi:hypothetical protein
LLRIIGVLNLLPLSWLDLKYRMFLSTHTTYTLPPSVAASCGEGSKDDLLLSIMLIVSPKYRE